MSLDEEIIDIAIKLESPALVSVASHVTDINIVATNFGPRGPKGDPGQWVSLTQAQYDALDPPDPDTLYVIIQ